MLARTLVVESSILNSKIPSHIARILTNSRQNRRFVKFPRIFDKQKPEIVTPSTVNLHDQNTGFTNFIKTLDSLVSTEEATVESFVSLFEKFEVSLSDDNEHLLKVLDSYDTGTLVLILDSLTYYNQSRTSKNINILLDDLCQVLAKRELLSSENENNGTTLTMLLVNLLNRIKHQSNDVKHLLNSIYKQVRTNVDMFLENGSLTHFLNLFCYSLDPSCIYTVVYCCLFKLNKFKHTDYTNLPRFLFNFKIYDPQVLTNVVTHASSSPLQVFESDGLSFGNFLKDLRLFDQLYNSNEIPFSPVVLYFEMLNKNMSLYNRDELLFILSNTPPLRVFDKSVTLEYQELVDKCLLNLGLVSEDKRFKGTGHLNNSQLMSFVNYLNKVEFKSNRIEWNQLKPVLLNETSSRSLLESELGFGSETGSASVSKSESDGLLFGSFMKDSELLFFNEVSKDLSARILREMPQNCKIKDVDEIFRKTDTVSSLFLLLEKFNSLNVVVIYTDSLTLSLKRLLSLLGESGSLEGDLFEFFTNLNRLNISLLREFSLELFNLVNKDDLELFEKALRFKLLHFKKNNMGMDSDGLSFGSFLKDFELFEVLKENLDYRNCMVLVNLLGLIDKSRKLVDDSNSIRNEFDKSFEKFSDIVYEGIKNEVRLLDYNLTELLLNLPENCKLLSKLDTLIYNEEVLERGKNKNKNKSGSGLNLKLPQLVTLFVYKVRRCSSRRSSNTMDEHNGDMKEEKVVEGVESLVDVEGVRSVKKLHDKLVSELEEFVETLESSFTQRVWVEQPSENSIRRINPWVNEHGLKHLFKKPEEPFDMFLYDKCPKLDCYFDLYKYTEQDQGKSGTNNLVSFLYDLRVELVEMNKQLVKEEMRIRLEKDREDQKNLEKMVSNLGSQIRRALLTVEMCRPISRNYYLPKNHTKELVKLSLKKFSNENKNI